MKQIVAKYRALVALVLVAYTAVGCAHHKAAPPGADAGIRAALEIAQKIGPARVTVRESPAKRFGMVRGQPIAWVYDPKFDTVTFVELKFGATGDDPNGWKIDPPTGALTAPSGKVIKGVSYQDSPAAVGTANLASLSGTQTVDGVSVTAGKKAWLFGQTTTTQDGCWIGAAGAWSRCTELATGDDAAGMYFAVGAGTSNKGLWIVTNAAGSGIAGTNDLTAQNLTTGGGGAVSSVFGRTGAVVAVAADYTPDQVGGLSGVDAAACTTKPLSAYVYANGTAGVGATITGTANQACDTIDGLTPSLTVGAGSYLHVLVNNGAAFTDNGLYIVTQVGDGSHPCILTRDPRVDSPGEIRANQIHITQGNTRRGAVYEYMNDPALTIGTTALAWIRVDAGRGPNEFAQWQSNFDQQTLTVSGTMVGEFPGFITVTGSGAITLVPGTATERGLFQFSTGTTTSGNSIVSFAASNRPLVIDSSQWFRFTVKLGNLSALSNGTDTYRVLAGIGDAISFPPANGIWVEYASAVSGTSWVGVNRTSSTNTTATGQLAAITQYDRFQAVKYAGETSIHWLQDGVEMTSSPISGAPIGTTVAMTPYITIQKTAGTTAATVNLDYYRFEQAWPNGNAL